MDRKLLGDCKFHLRIELSRLISFSLPRTYFLKLFLSLSLSLSHQLIIHQSRAACICLVQISCIIELTQKPELNNRCLERVMPRLIQFRRSFPSSYFCLAHIKISPGPFVSLLLWHSQRFNWKRGVDLKNEQSAEMTICYASSLEIHTSFGCT